MAQTAQTIITAALQEINASAPGETISANDLSWGLDKLNRLFDGWCSERLMAFAVNFVTYTLTPNLQPHTIGPTGTGATFTCTGNRPTKIVAAQLVINNVTPNYTVPINIRDADWWAAQRVQALTSTWPTDIYYEPDWPKGSLFIWPVPLTNWGLQLETWTTIGQAANLGASFSLPPGYWDAVIYNLAVSMCPAFEKQPNPVLVAEAKRTKAAIKSLNAVPPRIATGGDGLPSGTNRPSFDWRIGFSR